MRQCGFSETAVSAVHFIERNALYQVALLGVAESEHAALVRLMQRYTDS